MMSLESSEKHNILTLLTYFTVKNNCLFDLQSGVPYPLLSYCIHRLLPADRIGFNDPPTRELRDMLKTIEKETCIIVPTGSHVEGLQVSFFTNIQDISISDTDMFIIPKFSTVPEVDIYEMGIVPDMSPTQTMTASFQNAYPGYVIITPKNKFKPFTKCLDDITDFDEYTKDTLEIKNGGRLINKGPSLKAEVTYIDHFNNKIVGDSDHVYAFPSEHWPKQALGWLTRNRPARWPPMDLINHIKSLGTHYVKKPPKDTPDSVKEFYWRISFSFAERELAKSFNDTQRQCAILLKLLKQKEVLPSEVLTSYHMKTIMFWACEDIPTKVWVPHRLGQCFMLVLDRLYICVVQANLPHYFIPELNLLSGIPKCHRDSIAKCLLTLKQSPLNFLSLLNCSFYQWLVSFKYEDIATTANESDFVNEIGRQFSKTFPDMMIISAVILRIANIRFQRNNNFLGQFRKVVSFLHKTIDIIGTISTQNVPPYKGKYGDVIELAALIAVDETNCWPCCELIIICDQDAQKLQNRKKSLDIYKSLQEKHKDDTILFTSKMMFGLLAMLLGI